MHSDRLKPEGCPIEVKVTFSERLGPVTGTVLAPGGEPVGYHGWLELMDALETTRGAAGEPPPQPRRAQPPV
jgi:hypothetical protein